MYNSILVLKFQGAFESEGNYNIQNYSENLTYKKAFTVCPNTPKANKPKKKCLYLSWLAAWHICTLPMIMRLVDDAVAIIVLTSLYVNLHGLFAVDFCLFCPTDPSNTFFF